MKKLILIFAAIVLSACSSKTINQNFFVDEVEVSLSTQIIETSSTPMTYNRAMAQKGVLAAASESPNKTEYKTYSSSLSDLDFDDSYVHEVPTQYTAYFVSEEDKGDYFKGQVVETVSVVKGSNQITVPELKYSIYVTNFEKDSEWYTWEDALEQLPRTSEDLYLYGKTTTDFKLTTNSEVDLTNPYSAVMIKNNKWLNGTPRSNFGNQDFEIVTQDWYNLYVRNNQTDVNIPISIPGSYETQYTLSQPISPNKIYQYTINGNPKDTEGNILITVKDIEEGESKEIHI